jgi:exocyst complex component 7
MVRAGYARELIDAYSSLRRDLLDEYLTVLGAERLIINEVQRVEWTSIVGNGEGRALPTGEQF